MRTTVSRMVRIIAITSALGYLGVIGVLAFFENQLVYHPIPAAKGWMPPPIDDIQEVVLDSADGNRIGAWWLPCPGSDRSLLYLHGNAGNLSHRGSSVVKMRTLLNAGILIVDYPGYGKSTGRPSESGCYHAADAGYHFLVDQQKRSPESLILYGGSLGGAVAIDLASRKPHHGLVVVKSFTSAPDVGGKWFPWIPVRWIMRNQFRSIDKIGQIKSPVFIAHGDRDSIVPYEHGRILFEAASEPKAFIDLNGQDHNDPLPKSFFDDLSRFLETHPAVR